GYGETCIIAPAEYPINRPTSAVNPASRYTIYVVPRLRSPSDAESAIVQSAWPRTLCDLASWEARFCGHFRVTLPPGRSRSFSANIGFFRPTRNRSGEFSGADLKLLAQAQ